VRKSCRVWGDLVVEHERGHEEHADVAAEERRRRTVSCRREEEEDCRLQERGGEM